VKEVALRHNIAVSHDLNWVELNSHQNLLGIVVAYGRIIPGALLEKVPMINIHFLFCLVGAVRLQWNEPSWLVTQKQACASWT